MKPETVIGQNRSSWSILEVARRNGLSLQFVRLEIARGRLKAKRFGRRVLIPVQSERDWLESAPDRAEQDNQVHAHSVRA
jgi:excisionase family DNA binding protein